MINKTYIKEIFKENINSMIKSNLRLYCLLRILKNFNNIEFFKQIDLINKDPNNLRMLDFGEKNKDKNILLITRSSPNMGMGGFFRQTLYGLYEAEKLGFVPVVHYKECPYRDKSYDEKTKNPFEYYFNQTSNVSLQDAYDSSRIFIFDSIHLIRVEKELGNINSELVCGYNINNEYLKRLGQIVKRYVHLNEYTENFIKTSMQNIFPRDWKQERVLAIHVRGTDFALNWEKHPNMVGVEDFFSAIDSTMEKEKFKYIFLATDDSNRLKAFKMRYGEKLLYFTDVHRSSGTINVALEKNDRKHNNYLNGLEVIRDMYTLARCHGLIAGLSQVSICTRIINYSLDEQFSYVKILDKGIYKS